MKKSILAMAIAAFLISCGSNQTANPTTTDSTTVVQDTTVKADSVSGSGGSGGELKESLPVK